MAKTDFLQIRVTPEDRARIQRAAVEDYLDASTWARRAILRAVEESERRGGHRSDRAAGLPTDPQDSPHDTGMRNRGR